MAEEENGTVSKEIHPARGPERLGPEEPLQKKAKPEFVEEIEATKAVTILDLPPELLLDIFRYLDHTSISRCAQVCATFDELSKCSVLFREVKVTLYRPKKYCEWVMERARNPKIVLIETEILYVIPPKMSSWSNLEELCLVNVNLVFVGEGSLVNLRRLQLEACSIYCVTLAKLLSHSKLIREVRFIRNKCQCGRICQIGAMSLIPLETRVNTLHHVCLSIIRLTQQDLTQLIACPNLKTFDLSESLKRPNAELAFEEMFKVITKNCAKFEVFEFHNCRTYLSYHLRQKKFEGIPSNT